MIGSALTAAVAVVLAALVIPGTATAHEIGAISLGGGGGVPATVERASGAGDSSFECRLVGERFAPCASPMKLIKPRKGRHIFEARATDVAANVDPTPAEWTFKVRTKHR